MVDEVDEGLGAIVDAVAKTGTKAGCGFRLSSPGRESNPESSAMFRSPSGTCCRRCMTTREMAARCQSSFTVEAFEAFSREATKAESFARSRGLFSTILAASRRRSALSGWVITS